jgi:hypothetical protein
MVGTTGHAAGLAGGWIQSGCASVDQSQWLRQRAFGLAVQSTSPIPGFPACRGGPEPDLKIWLRRDPPWLDQVRAAAKQHWFTSRSQDSGGQPLLKVWKLAGGSHFWLRYSDATEFIVDRLGRQIWASWPESATLDDTATYLTGPVLGFVLRLRGTVCLHASAMAVRDQAVAVVGQGGAGKSTLAALFARQGFAVLTDDVSALVDGDDRFFVQPAYPHVRLWPESVSVLFGSPEALPRLTPSWEKRVLDLGQRELAFQDEPLPLGAIYVLHARRDEAGLPRVEASPARHAIVELVANTYAGPLLEPAMRAAEFDFLGRMVARVPVRIVTPHADPAQMSRLCEVILDDVRSLPPVERG